MLKVLLILVLASGRTRALNFDLLNVTYTGIKTVLPFQVVYLCILLTIS
jgi:hypothetical protein